MAAPASSFCENPLTHMLADRVGTGFAGLVLRDNDGRRWDLVDHGRGG